MAFFTAYFQKRALRFALSQLGLFDEDTFDLDSPDISWGSTTTIELRDAPLAISRLSGLLQLPPFVTITESRVSYLKLTLPLNFVSNAVAIEIEGVQLKLLISHNEEEDPDNKRKDDKSDIENQERGSQINSDARQGGGKLRFEDVQDGSYKVQSARYGEDAADTSRPPHVKTKSDMEKSQFVIPTTDDLAESFLAYEPPRERAEIASAIGHGSHNYTNLDEPGNVGLGPDISLKNFFSNLAKGVLDRFRASIKDIQIEVTFKLVPTSESGITYTHNSDEVVFCLDIDNVDIPPVNDDTVSAQSSPFHGESTKIRARDISVTGLHASLLFTSALSSFMTQLSHPPSPTLSRATSKLSETASSPRSVSKKPSLQTPSPYHIDRSPQSSRAGTKPEHLGRSETAGSVDSDSFSSDVGGTTSANMIVNELEDDDVVSTGHNSRNASVSGRIDGQHQMTDSQLFGSDHEDSSLGESAESFLSRPPTGPSSFYHQQTESSQHSTYASKASRRISSTQSSSHMALLAADEDLTESKLFSRREAKSMYISAISSDRRGRTLPGDWDSSGSEQNSPDSTTDIFHDALSPSTGQLLASNEPANSGAQSPNRSSFLEEDVEPVLPEDDDSPPQSLLISRHSDDFPTHSFASNSSGRNIVPRTQSSNQSSPSNSAKAESDIGIHGLVKTLLLIDFIKIQLPPAAPTALVTVPQSGAQETSHELPGAFSIYNPIEQSMTAAAQGSNDQINTAPDPPVSESTSKIVVQIGKIVCCFDMALMRLLSIVFGHLPNMSAPKAAQQAKSTSSDMSEFSFGMHLQQCILRFEQSLKSQKRHSLEARSIFTNEAFSSASGDLFRLSVKDLMTNVEQSHRHSLTEIFVAKLRIGFPDEDVMSFNQESRIRESVRDVLTPIGQDISIKKVQTSSSNIQFEINTAPLHINANVNRLVEVINWLGGLSTVLDLKNSMRSTLTITEAKNTQIKQKPKGVRFDVDSAPSREDQQPASKVNLRIGGIAINLVGSSASIRVEGSALKAVIRDGATRTQIDRINLYGPLTDNEKGNAPLMVTIETLQVAYFDLPKENDLTRLITLLSPSQDRDEQDDDILLDTLLRQRRKGGLLRINISKARLGVSKLQKFHHINTLMEEASQLSSVAKYLPEDDRPGLLVVTKLDSVNVDLDINGKIPPISLGIRNTEVAIVTFPSLFLMSVGHLTASHSGLELIGTATPGIKLPLLKQAISAPSIPNISIKFIAGEMEPTVRVKLHNIRAEYHVTTVMSLLGIRETASGDIIVAEMVNSIANLAANQPRVDQSFVFQQAPAAKDQKPIGFDISVRDVIIGLNPKDKPVKGLLLLTKSQFSGIYSDGQATNNDISSTISKAHLMVVDNKENILAAEDITDPIILSGLGSKPTQLQCLEVVGYVSVGQVSGANIMATLTESSHGNLLDVKVRDTLFVLETCADSTQTLLSILGGLAPPLPPRKGNKYRTEVIPVSDMLASFSGQGFATAADSESDNDDAVSFDDDNETMARDDIDDLNDDLDLDDELSGGLSTEDHSLASFDVDSVLIRQPAESGHSAHLDLSSMDDEPRITSSISFGTSQLGKFGKSRAREWNSYTGKYYAARSEMIDRSPLQISLKDMHFIWNLFDGYDWQSTRDAITNEMDKLEKVANRREKPRAVEDDAADYMVSPMLFNSFYIAVSAKDNIGWAKDDPRHLRDRIDEVLNGAPSETASQSTTTTTTASGTLKRRSSPRRKRKHLQFGRSKHHKMKFELKGISGLIVSYPPDNGETQSSIDIKVYDLEVFDNMPSSTWRKFATYMHDAGSRQKAANMVHLELLVVKPDPDLLASEFVLKVSLLPLRLHVDQDALDFITRFFEFRDETTGNGPSSPQDVPFIQRAEVGPVEVKLDFKPKTTDYRALLSGKTAEFKNLMILDGAEMTLRQIILYGVKGFDKLGHTLNELWTPDVKKYQLSRVLAGLAPVRPLVNVGMGVRDLVVVPMREYKKDGRLVRAVRKGVVSFGKTTSTELAKLGAKLAIGTHTMLSNAEGLLSPEAKPSSTSYDDEMSGSELEERPTVSPYANPPIGVVQGLRGAYRGLERDLLLAKDAIVAMPGEVMESGNASGAAAAILRNAPVVILRPAMGVTNAIGQTLMGATNSLDKNARRRTEDKYKH